MFNESEANTQESMFDTQTGQNYQTRQVDLVVYTPEMDKIKLSIAYNATVSDLNNLINLMLKEDPTITIANNKKLVKKETKTSTCSGVHAADRFWGFSIDGGALDDTKPLFHYKLVNGATLYMHKEMNLTIDGFPDGVNTKHYKVKVFPTDTILTVKKKISRVSEIPVHNFLLTAQGKQSLIEAKTLKFYDIKPRTTLYMQKIHTVMKECKRQHPVPKDPDPKIKLLFKIPPSQKNYSIKVVKTLTCEELIKAICQKHFKLEQEASYNDINFEVMMMDPELYCLNFGGSELLPYKTLKDYNLLHSDCVYMCLK